MATANPFLGVGLYTIPEAAVLLRVTPRRLRGWASGYTFRRAGESLRSEPIFRRDLQGLTEEEILTFADLIELRLIGMFRREGVRLSYIRDVAEWASKHFQMAHPFAIRQFHTDGRRIFVEQEAKPRGPRILAEARSSQLVMDGPARLYFRQLEYEDDWVSRFWPLGKEGGVVLDPKRCFGKPIIARAGVPTLTLYQTVLAERSIERTAKWYDVRPSEVRAAVRYEKSLAA
jgi:uncharacterized protein (DUF433 family)/DNA-binding transcriptional MerR regulator